MNKKNNSLETPDSQVENSTGDRGSDARDQIPDASHRIPDVGYRLPGKLQRTMALFDCEQESIDHLAELP